MKTTFYIEQEIRQHPRTLKLLQKFPSARILEITRYSEVFNRKNQDFRKQKDQGKVFILANKVDHFVLPVSLCYSLESEKNYYFSHLYNCPYDCQYCYLQGMYRSAYFVLFVNYEDFEQKIRETALLHAGKSMTFFSGYDGDSLALEQITEFAGHFVPFFEQFSSNVQMELRTKSANIQSLLQLSVPQNTVVTWTLSPNTICEQYEYRAANLLARIAALTTLQKRGWRIEIRIEPVIFVADWKDQYHQFLQLLSQKIDLNKIEKIAFGHFRVPKEMLKKMQKMQPQSKLLHQYYELRSHGEMSYPQEKEQQMTNFLLQELQKIFPLERIAYYQGK